MIGKPENEQTHLEINTINFKKKRLELTKQITWEDFKGKIDENMPWKAHIYWQINYSYFVDIGKTIKIHIKSFCKVCTKKSWVREPNEKLLQHEQGHYDIGIMCSLYFKKSAQNFKFTAWDYKKEVKKLFDECLKQYQKIEKNYDNETDHGRNDQKQMFWDFFIAKQLIELNEN